MKKINLWLKIKSQALTAEKKGPAFVETTARRAGEMAKELERMGRLGGQLFVMRAG